MIAIAKTTTLVCPDLVDPKAYGHHKSKVSGGLRTWEFEDEKKRDRFLKAVGKGAFTRKWAKHK